jgi:hypothetical protein
MSNETPQEIGMGNLLKEYPFAFALAFVGAGAASWFGWSWFAILVSAFVGLFVGAGIDYSRNESRSK